MDLLEPFAGVETGTGLADAGEVAVTEDLGIGEVDAEAAEQFFHGDLLSFGAGVGRTTLGIESAFVADAYAVLVEVEGVGAYFVLGSAGVEGAVAGDVVVIADAAVATGFMAGFELLDGETLGDSRRAAMQHDERDVTVFFHSRQIFLVNKRWGGHLHSAAAGDAEGAGNGGENGNDEVDDVFQCFFFHNGLIFFNG